VIVLAACGGKKEPEKQDSPAPAPAPKTTPTAPNAGPAKAPSMAPPKDKPAASVDGPNAKRCKELLARTWKAAQPGFAKLEVAIDPALEKAYTENENYLKACNALAADKLDCLEKAENPIAGIDTCKVNEGAAQSLSLHSVERKIGVLARKPLDKAEADKQLAALEGTWENEWVALKEKTTWVIGKDGAVTKAEVLKDGKPKEKASVPDKLMIEEEGRLKAHWKGSSTTQTLSFFKNGNEFYASTNSLYDAYLVPDQKKFVVRYDWTYITFDGGKCEAINMNGLTTEATCSFATDKGNKVFKAEWQFPGDRGKRKSEHILVGKHFVHKSMYEIGRFKKK
jgi:hypothetical protein